MIVADARVVNRGGSIQKIESRMNERAGMFAMAFGWDGLLRKQLYSE